MREDIEQKRLPEHVAAESRVAILGHALHPMLVTFPIAFLSAALLTDVVYWWLAEPFWARFSFWLLVGGLAGGALAALAGFLDFLLVKAIRDHTSSWSHFLCGIVALAITTANLLIRWNDYEAGVLPWGLFTSAFMWLALAVTGWLGGKLVFEHHLGPGAPD